MKKTVEDIDVAGKPVLVRMDFNVPLDNGSVADDARIRASVPTIEHLRQKGARTMLCSHLGRPKGKVVASLRLDPVAEALSERIKGPVRKVDDCVGGAVADAAAAMADGDVILLENTRFHPEEKENDPDFAARLAEPASVFVNDAFAAAHRAHASTEGVAHRLPAVAGLLMARELRNLSEVLDNAERPFAAIVGGAKISDKIGVLNRLLDIADVLMLGGGMANTFLSAGGHRLGDSLVEKDAVDAAKRFLDTAGDRLVLPTDAVIAPELSADAPRQTVSVGAIPDDWRIVDIGPETIDRFQEHLDGARTVVWNGPLGVTELSSFAEGTHAVARILADMDAVTVVGGGDSGAAIARAGVADSITHVSTGGGAFLDFLEGKKLPAVAVLQEK